MKIKIGDKVYLQKYEVAFIMHNLNDFPDSIFRETFGEVNGKLFFMSGSVDCFQFKQVYKKPENVEWLMAQDWIVDYDEYSKMSLAELKTLYKRLRKKRSADIREFNAKDKDYRKAHFDEEDDKFNKLGHKIDSLEGIIDYRKGKVKFIFPKEYKNKTTSTPQKKPSFFARLFGRSAQ